MPHLDIRRWSKNRNSRNIGQFARDESEISILICLLTFVQ